MCNENMRGLFFVVKGQYAKGVQPSFVNKVSGDVSHIGGYDPFSKNTTEWYMVLDNKTFNCIACGGNLNKVLKSVHKVIKTYKGSAKAYFRHVSEVTSDDYYEVTYLGKPPLTHDQRVAKAEGRCPRVSPVMRCLYEKIYEEYGDYYEEEVQEMEELAYNELREDKPIHKTRKLMSKMKTKKLVKSEPPQKQVEETPQRKVVKKPKVKIGKKLL